MTIVFNITAMTSKMKERERHFFTQRNKDTPATPKKGTKQAVSQSKVNGEASSNDKFMWTEEDDESQQDPKRWSRNYIEKRRKDRIKSGILQLGELLPDEYCARGQTTNEILDHAVKFVQEIRDKRDKVLLESGDKAQAEEIKRLRKELESVKSERDRFKQLLENAGIPTCLDPTTNWAAYRKNPSTEALERMAATQLATLADRTMLQAQNEAGDQQIVTKVSPKEKGSKKRPGLVSEQLKQREVSKRTETQKADEQDKLSFPDVETPVASIIGSMDATDNLISEPIVSATNVNASMADTNVMPAPPLPGMPQYSMAGVWPTPGIPNMGMQNIGGDGLLQIAPSGQLQQSESVTVSPSSSMVAGNQNIMVNPSPMISNNVAMTTTVPSSSNLPSTEVPSTMNITNTSALPAPMSMPNMAQQGLPQCSPAVGGPMFPGQPIPVGTVQNQGLQGTLVLGPNGQLILLNDSTPASALMNMNMSNPAGGAVANSVGGMVSAGGQMAPPMMTADSNQMAGGQLVSNPGIVSSKPPEPTVLTDSNASSNMMIAGTQGMQLTPGMNQDGGLIGLPPVATEGLTMMASNQGAGMPTMQNSSMPVMVSQPAGANQPQITMGGMPNQPILNQQGIMGQAAPQMNLQPQQLMGAAGTVTNQVMIPGSNGMVPVNPGTGQAGNLPSALILPNGQIVPVVTQPQLLFQQATPVSGGLVVAPNNPGMPMINGMRPAMPVAPMPQNGIMQGVQNQPNINMSMPDVNAQQQINTPVNAPTTTTMSSSTQPVSVLNQPISSAQISQTISNAAAAAGIINASGTQVSSQSDGPISSSVPSNTGQLPIMPITRGSEGQVPNMSSYPKTMTSQVAANTSVTVSQPSASGGSASSGKKTSSAGGLPQVTQLPTTATAVLAPDGSIILTLAPSNTPVIDPRNVPVLPNVGQPMVAMEPAQNKKSSKSGKQRDIKPKRSSKSSKSSNAESSQRNVASPSVNASSAGNASTVAAPLTVNTEVTSSSTGAPTDILAKAAESIFSSGMNDVSPPISSYYNPAHDDNPLQIDTSVTEAEEQGDVSPHKSSEKEVHEPPPDPKNAVNQGTLEQDPVSLAFSAAVGEVTSESLTANVTSEVQVNQAPPISQIVSPPTADTVTNVTNVDAMPPPLTAEPAPTPTKSSRKSKKKSKNKAQKAAPPPEPPPPEILPQVPVDDIDVKTMNSMEVDLNSSNTDDVEQILQEAEKLTRDIPIDNLPPTPAPPPPLIDHIEEALPTESPKGKTKKKKSKKDKSKNKEKKSSAKEAVLDTSAELEKITAIENAGQLTIAASNTDTMLPVTTSSVLSMPSGFEIFGIQEPSVESQQNTAEKPTAQNCKKLETQSQQEVPEVTSPTGSTKSSRKNRSNKRKNSNPVDMLPKILSFSENQLPDVLDQLERYSDSIQQDSPKKSSKKSKHSGGDSSAEPPSKKKKKSSKAKEDKTVQDPLTSPGAVSMASLSPVSQASKISPLKDSDLTQEQHVVMQTPSPPKLTKSQPAVKLASPNKSDVITSLAEISSLNSNDMNSSGDLGDPKRIGDADLTMEGVKDMQVIDESADQDSSLMDLIGENLNLLSEMATSQSAQDTEARDSVLDNISKSTADKENDKRQDKPAQELSAIHTTLPATPGRVRHENLPQLPSRLSHKTMASSATTPQSKAPPDVSQNNAMQSSVNPEGSCNKNVPAAPQSAGQKQENLQRNSAEPSIPSQNSSRPLSHPPQPFNKTPEGTPPALTHSQTFSKSPDSTPPALTHSVESLFSDSGEPITVQKNPAPTETSRQVPVVHSTGRAPPPASAAGQASSQPPTSQANRDQPLFHNSSKSQPVPSAAVNRTKESRPTSAQARNVSQPGQQQPPYTSPTFGMAAPRSGQSTTVANSNPTYTQPTTAPSFSFSLSSTTSTPTSASFSRQSGYPQFPFYPMPPIGSQEMLGGKVREEQSSLSLSEMSNSMGQRSMVPPSHSASQRHEHQGAPAQGPASHPHPSMGGFSMGSNSSVAQQREPQQCMQMGRPERETGRSSSAQGRLPGPSPTQPSGASASQGHSNQDISPFYQPNSYSSNSASLSLTSPPLHHHPPRPGGTSSSSSASSYQSSYSSVHQYNPTPFSAPSYDPPPLVFTQSTSGSSQTRTDSCAANQAAARKKATQERAESHRAKSVTSAKQHQSVEPQSHSTATQKSSRSSKSKKNSAKQYEMESMANPFDPSRSLTPYLPFSNMSPPPRNLANETPSYLPANLFAGHSRPLSNANPQQHKNTDINNPFNPLFPPGRTQNGLGFNFQPSFGMNPMHGNHGNSSQITPHSSSMSVPHMPNFNFSNIFNDMNSHPQNDSLNISPIKFPHGNPILPPQAGMDHNSLQHHHQGSSLYHNRPHLPPHQPVIHNAMTINSILGHNPHGFDARPMGPGINSAPFPAHGHAASFGMPPPLNFSMHDH